MKTNKFNKIWLVLGLLVVIVLSACSGTSNTNKNDFNRSIIATGQGQIYLTPDIAYIYIGVHTESEKVTDALSANSTQAQAVSKALLEMGVDQKDIQTSALNVYPQQKYGPAGELLGTFYAVDNTVFVKIRDLVKIGDILDAVVRSGANSINSISFDVEDKTKAISDARKLAVENARKQAEELASAAGVKLGDLLSLNAYTTGIANPITYDAAMGKGGAGGVVPPVSAGQLVITVEANMTYEIK
jgi:uncharacterized protein